MAQGFGLSAREVGGAESLVQYVERLVNGSAPQQNLTPAVGITSHFQVLISCAPLECPVLHTRRAALAVRNQRQGPGVFMILALRRSTWQSKAQGN